MEQLRAGIVHDREHRFGLGVRQLHRVGLGARLRPRRVQPYRADGGAVLPQRGRPAAGGLAQHAEQGE
ncbi:MAG: hypothetical protein M3Q39_00945 [Actinomycetota bacterium]|nr:hypothetical protein [Actinomycetota bacterium]